MITIITDSSSEMLAKQQKELNIKVLPMPINFGDDTYLSGKTLSNDDFYKMLKESKALPTTSMVNSFTFEQAFKEEVKKGNEVLAITISSHLSVTFSQAEEAAKAVDEKKVLVLDSLNASLGQSLIVMEAVRLRDAGKSLNEIYAILEEKKKKAKAYAFVDTLKFLKAGGRLTGAAAFIGTMLNVKPIIAVENGKVVSKSKAIGKNNAFKSVINISEKFNIDDNNVVFAYSDSMDMMHEFKNMFDNKLTFKNTDIVQIGSTIGVHVGHGAVAVAFFEK